MKNLNLFTALIIAASITAGLLLASKGSLEPVDEVVARITAVIPDTGLYQQETVEPAPTSTPETGPDPAGTPTAEPAPTATTPADEVLPADASGVQETDAGANDWAQVQKNPQHTGYTPEILGTNIQVRWVFNFLPDKIYPQTQAIVYGSKIFVGTEMGHMYGFNATTGAVLWKYSTGSIIMNSAAVESNRVFFGAMDGAVYALDANTGALLWKNKVSPRLGFSTAPVFADNKVMLGGRDGNFYAFDPATGNVVWQYRVGSPILQTAAWNNNKAYFGANDMRVYAVNTTNGTLAWKSQKLQGLSFKDYWPLVYQGLVYIRPVGISTLGTDRETITDAAAQQAVLNDYAANPGKYSLSMFRLKETDGTLATQVIHYDDQTMNGATTPSCVDKDGNLIISAPYFSGYKTGWGKLNPTSRVVTALLFDGTETGFGNEDENLNVTCTGNMVLSFHTQEMNANYTGAFDLNSNRWYHILPGHVTRDMANNTQGGGGNPATVSNGWIYHISFQQLIARSTN